VLPALLSLRLLPSVAVLAVLAVLLLSCWAAVPSEESSCVADTVPAVLVLGTRPRARPR
jgi:hypothetical protein